MGPCASTTNEQPAIKVLLRSLDCEYIAGKEGRWGLTRDRSKATAFDYLRDRVDEQLQVLRKTRGLILVAEAKDPREAYETCDRCSRTLLPLNAHFDGKQFLCPCCAATLPAASEEVRAKHPHPKTRRTDP
jgi:hypothetical protein